jgi:hypothetical protein
MPHEHQEPAGDVGVDPSRGFGNVPKRFYPAVRPGWEEPKPAELPKPTYAPVTVAMGLTLAFAGVVTSFWVSLAGGILFVLGLVRWIGELR